MSPRKLQIASIVLSFMLLAFVALASAKRATRHPVPPPLSASIEVCSPGHVEDVRLHKVMAIDEIRVDVARFSPVDGAANIYVWDGHVSRVLRIRGQASQRLTFSPPIRAAHLYVSLEPVYTAPTSACVNRVELLVRGVPVAEVTP